MSSLYSSFLVPVVAAGVLATACNRVTVLPAMGDTRPLYAGEFVSDGEISDARYMDSQCADGYVVDSDHNVDVPLHRNRMRQERRIGFHCAPPRDTPRTANAASTANPVTRTGDSERE